MYSKKKIGTCLISIFFFLMLTLPTSFQIFRGVLLMIILFLTVQNITPTSFRYDKTILFIGLLNLLFSFLFILNGVIRLSPGAIRVSTVFLVWPILYFYFIGLSNKVLALRPILNTIIYGGLGSSFLILLFVYNNFLGFPVDISFLVKAQDFGFYWGSGFVEMNSMNLTTVFYVFVFVLTIFLIPSKLNFSNFNKNVIGFTFLICTILLFISSRRAFWIVCTISPVVIFVLLKLSKINLNLRRFIIPTILFFSMAFVFVGYLALDNDNLITEFKSSFEFDNPEAESNYIRKEQYDALINGWEKNWFFGAGLGASAKGSIRDVDMPWAYELSYVALLFQTGIVGVTIYLSSVLWIIFNSIIICRKNSYYIFYLLPQIAALICFLLVNATNPYLAKFDYLWTIFLPLATLNAIKLDSNKFNALEN